MTVKVSQEVERLIDAAVQSGRYASADEMITSLVREDFSRRQESVDRPRESPEQWIHRLQTWVESHPVRSIIIDDSRESLYAGRGE